MTRDELLRRVEGDLSLGHTHLAINRLTMAAKSSPSDLVLRDRLAALHRQTGNWAEAGRWGYFEDPVDERSRQAFEKAWRGPQAQLHALRWTRADDDPDLVRGRLDCLEASLPANSPADAEVSEVGQVGGFALAIGCVVAFVLVALLVLVIVAGIVALIDWLA